MPTLDTELAVIGGGPAGASAAIRAAALGLEVVLIDEGSAAGGQVWRAPDQRHAVPDAGDTLRAALAASGATCLFGHRLWHVGAERRLVLLGPDGMVTVQARAVLVAAGAIERFHPFPGWTLPGVIGLAAATILLKAHGVLPGRRVVVAGPGPLAPLVANGIHAAGGSVVALVDPSSSADWLRAVPAMVRRPALGWRGLHWMAALKAARTPVLRGHRIVTVEQESADLTVTVADRHGASTRFSADAVCVGNGLQPSTEIARLLGAEIRYDAAAGGWIPVTDSDGRLRIPLTYAIGDGAGIRGAEAAVLAGRLAALAAAVDLGRLDPADVAAEIAHERRALARAARFGAAMTRLMAPAPRALADLPDPTIVCRCEDLAAGTLRVAIKDGAVSLGALKSATRCGMGPCGGRVCAEAATALIEEAGLDRAAIPPATARAPLRPVPVTALTGAFVYSDIPLPEPSPA